MKEEPINGDYWWVRKARGSITIGQFHIDAEGCGYFLLVGAGDFAYSASELELVARIQPPGFSNGYRTNGYQLYAGSSS